MTRPSILNQKQTIQLLDWTRKTTIYIGSYAAWVVFVRLLTLSLITYFSISPITHFQDINDAFSSNEVSLMGLSALLFVTILYQLNPLQHDSLSEIVSQEKIEKYFLPGFLRGSLLAGGLVLLFLVAGFYRYLGYFIRLEEAPIELANVLLRMAALAILTYCEEYIFRKKMVQQLKTHLPIFACAQITSLAYCSVKLLQFDLGWMHLLTLYLISLCLFYRAQNEGEFAKGAGLWAATLIVFHPLFSLPIFGNNFTGMFLIKSQSSIAQSTGSLFSSNWNSVIRMISGGAGGPISSLALQAILLCDILRNIWKHHRNRRS